MSSHGIAVGGYRPGRTTSHHGGPQPGLRIITQNQPTNTPLLPIPRAIEELKVEPMCKHGNSAPARRCLEPHVHRLHYLRTPRCELHSEKFNSPSALHVSPCRLHYSCMRHPGPPTLLFSTIHPVTLHCFFRSRPRSRALTSRSPFRFQNSHLAGWYWDDALPDTPSL